MSVIAGPIVGAIGTSAPAGSAALADQGEGYDFAIGGHGFRLAISDERKYERATAQFRKEQYDASDKTGDQSLLGYWTRGQLSFHKGAGQRYAELGEDTDTRYWAGVGANPFVRGEVSLYRGWGAATPDSYTGIIDCLAVGTGSLAVLADGRITYGEIGVAGEAYPALDSGRAANCLTVGGGNIYAAMSDNKIDRVGLALTFPEVYSQGFETDTDSWSSSLNWGFDLASTNARVTSGPIHEGTACLEVTWPATGAADASNAYRALTGLTPGRAYTVVANLYAATGTGANIKGWVFQTGTYGSGIPDTTWTEYSYTFTATSATHWVGFRNSDLGASPTTLRIDKVRVYEGARTGYDDGTPPTDSIYSHTRRLVEVSYVKDRLFVMDSQGNWYQLAPNPSASLPVAISDADKVFTATTEGSWTVCDTPGPVLLGNQNRIFAVTQDTDGLFPTLSSPIQVADLPVGESVMGMKYYLGFVVLVTTKGVRVAVLGDSGITYGPRLVEWSVNSLRTGIARVGESVFVAADSRIIEVNLGSQIGSGLEFGWAELPSPFSAAVNHGVTQVGGSVVAWGGDVLELQYPGTTADSGYIETSYHRFGTLEPKKFHAVSVRASGSTGTVTISKVTPTGSVVSLFTMPASDGEAEVTLRADEPEDRLALRFDLTGDAKLLSYQLRALPAPSRQRMIRVPLTMHDVERRGTTRATGREGAAWERLRALEAMEAESGIVTYQDFRTGESGQCYIEQVAFESDTPPGRQSDGFGGIVFVTLRTL